MSHLAYIPAYINQNNDQQPGGPPDVNARNNCVAASIAWADESLKHETYYAEQVKDAVYGNSYVGMTAEQAYEQWEQSQGVKLWSFSSNSPTALIAAVHSFLAQGFPVLVTMPSQWGIPINQQPAGFTTHVGCAFSDDGGGIHVMNPWGGFDHYGSDDYWAARLCYNTVWPMSLAGVVPMGVPAGWHDDGKTLTAPNGKTVLLGDRDYILNHNWAGDNVPVDDGERYISSLLYQDGRWGPGSRRVFRYSYLVYPTNPDPALGLTKNTVYEIRQLGPEVLFLESTLATLSSQIEKLQTELASANATISADANTIQLDVAEIAKLQQSQGNPTANAVLSDLQQVEQLLNGSTTPPATPTA